MLCDLLEQAVGDYTEKVQNFIIESNWAQLYGKNFNNEITNQDIAYALTARSLDMMKDFGDWFSKQVGLQQHGKWELKKDFFKIEEGRQVYLVPAGREINKVLWITPPTTQTSLWANYGGFSTAFGGGVMGQMGLGAASVFGGTNSGYGMGVGMWALPMADVAIMAADLSFKNQMIRSDLVYKVTAGPDGSHLIHLLSTPGSKLTFGAGGFPGMYSLKDCYVWYTYYDTATAEEADECARANAGDVILTPDRVQLSNIDYAFLNDPTKTIIRQLLIAKAKQTLGLVRGKFSGKVNIPQAEATMDYQMLNEQGKTEWDNTMKELTERLQRMKPSAILEEQAKIVETTMNIQKQIPLQIYAI
jgi:hypothetical protein